MYKLTAILTAMVIAFGVVAEEAKAKIDNMAQRRELAEKFMVTMKVEAQLKNSFKMVRQVQSQMLEKMLKNTKEVENAEKAQAKMMKIVEDEMSWDKLKPIFVDTYASVYSAEELSALIKFFSSPVGQSFVSKSPQANKVAMMKMQSIMINMANRMKSEVEKLKQDAIKAKEKKILPVPVDKKNTGSDKKDEEDTNNDNQMM